MRRILFHSAAAVSFVLLVSACVMWVRSYWVSENVFIPGWFNKGWGAHVTRGQLAFTWALGEVDAWRELRFSYDVYSMQGMFNITPTYDVHWSALGFEFIRERGQSPYWEIRSPFWFIAGVLAFLPGVWMIRARRQRQPLLRAAAGRCPQCDYDLRSASSNSCPECGSHRWID